MSVTSAITHPNREKAASRAMRGAAWAALAASTVLLLVIATRGADLMQSSSAPLYVLVGLNVVLLIQVARWSRGALPMAAGLAVFVAIFAGVAYGSWTQRDAPGFTDPSVSHDLGLVVVGLLVVQLLVIATAVTGFAQNWHEEVEVGEPVG